MNKMMGSGALRLVVRRLHQTRPPKAEQMASVAMRLPIAVFPTQAVSLPILNDDPEQRPVPGTITPDLAHEVATSGQGLVLLAAGAHVGTVVDVLLPAPAQADNRALHVVGRQRVSLLWTAQRTQARGRMAVFSEFNDDVASAQTQARLLRELKAEAAVARTLLESHTVDGRVYDGGLLQPCTFTDMDMGQGKAGRIDPSAHPYWQCDARIPEDDTISPFSSNKVTVSSSLIPLRQNTLNSPAESDVPAGKM